MPKVGLSRPYTALYHDNGAGGVTYSDGIRAGRAVEYSLEIKTGDSNDFYADNQLAESVAGTFSSGTLTVSVAELEQAIAKMWLGVKDSDVTVDGETVKELIYDDDAVAPLVGFGVIVKGIKNGVPYYRGVVLRKVRFSIPKDEAKTQEDKIDWQTDEIEGSMMRDDTEKHMWKREATFSSESKADAYICQMLGITDAKLDSLTIVSVAGTAAGKTAITVTPELASGRSYRYVTGADAAIPILRQSLSSWNTWDGSAEITAVTGEKIVIAEVDTSGRAMAAGITTVTSKGE